jgi:hypothetical protein
MNLISVAANKQMRRTLHVNFYLSTLIEQVLRSRFGLPIVGILIHADAVDYSRK